MSRLEVKTDKFAQVLKSINALVSKQVLIGVPDTTTDRPDGGINNATLGYIHEFGSPAANIPARPFLIPGVEDSQGAITERFNKAAKAALNGSMAAVESQMAAAGQETADTVREHVGVDVEPLKPATVRNRRNSRDTQSRRASELEYGQLLKEGATPDEAQSAANIRPLVNTGSLLKSITYVVRKAQ